MKEMFRTPKGSGWIALFFVIASFIASGPSATTAPLQAARVTVVVKDVKLLPSQAAARAANVSDTVSTGTAVWTGLDSRAELAFNDLTITRLGASTVFSFNEGTRNLDLGSGAVLMQVPRGAAALHITTASVTAGITGGTALFECHAGAPTKLLVLEGRGRLCSKAHPDECATAQGGEMTMMTVDGHIAKPFKFNAALVFKTSKLIKGFPSLPNQDLILSVIEEQQAELLGESGQTSQANSRDPVDVISTSVVASGASSATSPPSKFGPPSAINSPNPYVITSGTAINTDPTITTNGVTNFGKIYRGADQDGALPTWLGSSPSAFDAAFNEHFGNPDPDVLPIVGFLFSSLRLDGDPTISNASNYPTLGLASQNGITSNPSGAVFTFGGIQRVALIALNGSIDLSGISFANFGELFIYARGTGSNLTFAAPVSNLDRVQLRAENDVQVNAPVSVVGTIQDHRGFKALAGNNIAVNSNVSSTGGDITLEALGSIQIQSTAQLLTMLDSVGNSGDVVILATGTNGSVDVSGNVQADQATVDIEQTGDAGVININKATLHGDIVKIGALGANGVLNIGSGTGLSADTEIDLYAGGSNGTLNFLSSVTLSSPKNVLAANTINIAAGAVVTIQSAQAADVFTNHPNYFGFGGTGTPATSGTFGGAGAKNPQPLSQAPPF